MQSKKEVLNNIKAFHNWSLYDEIYNRNKDGLDRIAIFYRGVNITYGEMFQKANEYAKSLVAHGVKQADEIPICMANTPELVYLILAASIIGAKVNIFGEEFDKDYITQIIDDCKSPYVFISDDKYEKLKDSISNSKTNKIVMTSLTSSLKNGVDPFNKIDKHFYKFENKLDKYKSDNPNIISINEFMVKDYNGKYKYEDTKLDDVFSTTYSSGSTNSVRPKGIEHVNKSYIAMGYSHNPEVSDTPSMKNLKVLAQIPSHSNTNIQSCITDSLIQGSTVCLEPIYDKDFFMYSLMINKPNFPCATRSFWVHLSKKIMKLKEQNIHVKFPFLLAPMSVGEPLSMGEEKLCNKMLKMTKSGTGFTHTPVCVICMSIAGGDCEHGGIFFVMFRGLTTKLKRISKEEYDILRTYSTVDVIVVDENGNVLEKGKVGRLYASSESNMKEYRNNKEATDKYFMEKDGIKYGDCSVYGYIGQKDYIHVKGRMDKFSKVPTYEISDEILKDTKNILSCETVEIDDDSYGKIYVAHIELQPDKKYLESTCLMSALNRCKKKFDKEVTDKIVFRIRSNEESYPLSGCGKRVTKPLIQEGISDNCIRPIRTHKNPESYLIDGKQYLEKLQQKNKKLTYCK